MNRQYKRLMKREQQRKASAPRPVPKAAAAPAKKERAKPRQFLKEVVAELRKVAWPTRQEVAGYSAVVLIGVVVMGALIFAMDYVFAKVILALFGVDV